MGYANDTSDIEHANDIPALIRPSHCSYVQEDDHAEAQGS